MVRLTVTDILGKEIKILADGKIQSGAHEYNFDGSSLPGGVYFCKLRINGRIQSKKMLIVK